MFNVAPASRGGTGCAHRAVSVRRPAADADQLPVPHHQPLRARIQRHDQIGQRAVSLQSAHHDLRELVGGLQERWLQPALQRRAARQRADLIRRRNRGDVRTGLKWIRRTAARERGGVPERLRRHPDDVSPGRRAAAVQCGRCVHRWRRTRARIRAHAGIPARCQRRIPGCEVRQHHATAAFRAGDADGDRDLEQPPAVHAAVAEPSGTLVRIPHGFELAAHAARRCELYRHAILRRGKLARRSRRWIRSRW